MFGLLGPVLPAVNQLDNPEPGIIGADKQDDRTEVLPPIRPW